MPEIHVDSNKSERSLETPDDMVSEFIECPTCNEMIEVLIRRPRVEPPQPPGTAPHPLALAFAPTSGLAISSLVLGILSVFLCITAIPGVICGHFSLRCIRKSDGRLGGKGMAIAGLVIAYVALALWLGIGLPLFLSHAT